MDDSKIMMEWKVVSSNIAPKKWKKIKVPGHGKQNIARTYTSQDMIPYPESLA